MDFTLTFDWRATWSQKVFEALAHGLNDLEREKPEHWDGFDINEHAEHLLGVAFVVVQTHVIGFAEAFKGRAPEGVKPKQWRQSLLGGFGLRVASSTVGRIELCYALGNYYKHHEEWPDWQLVDARRATIEVLCRVGISETTPHPCCAGAEILELAQTGKFKPTILQDDLRAWHEAVLKAHPP